MAMDMDRVKQLFHSMETTSKNGQELARACMDKEPSQRSQNNNWRYIMQDIRELKKIVMGEDA